MEKLNNLKTFVFQNEIKFHFFTKKLKKFVIRAMMAQGKLLEGMRPTCADLENYILCWELKHRDYFKSAAGRWKASDDSVGLSMVFQ